MDKWKKLGLIFWWMCWEAFSLALGTYNFAAASRFPMVGLNGVAPDFLSFI